MQYIVQSGPVKGCLFIALGVTSSTLWRIYDFVTLSWSKVIIEHGGLARGCRRFRYSSVYPCRAKITIFAKVIERPICSFSTSLFRNIDVNMVFWFNCARDNVVQVVCQKRTWHTVVFDPPTPKGAACSIFNWNFKTQLKCMCRVTLCVATTSEHRYCPAGPRHLQLLQVHGCHVCYF